VSPTFAWAVGGNMLLHIKAGGHVRCFALIFLLVLAFSFNGASQSPSSPQIDADTLVHQLSDLPAPLPVSVRSDGSIPPEARRRRVLYEEILRLKSKGVLALSRALQDDDVHLRKNAALAL